MAARQLVDDALDLVDAGFFVIALVKGTKKPAFAKTGAGHSDVATQDRDMVERWFTPDQHDLGVVPWLSRHAIADVDVKNGQSGASSLPRLEEESGFSMRQRWSDVTATALTQNRGWHYYFRLPDGVEANELRGQLAPGVELKQRHLVVVPPSGNRRWHRHPRDGCLEMPVSLVEIARKPLRAARGHVYEGVDTVSSIAALHRWLGHRDEGERNNGLYWAACRAAEMVERGEVSPASAWLLVETAVKIGLPRREAESTVASALGRFRCDTTRVAPNAVVPAVRPVIIAETGELVQAPASRNGPVWEKIPRSLNNAALGHGEFGLLVKMWLGRNYRTGTFEATTQALAERCDCDPRTLRRWLDSLERGGWITRSRADGRYGGLIFRVREPAE